MAGPGPLGLLLMPAAGVQDSERKARRDPKETPEELQECEMVFAAF